MSRRLAQILLPRPSRSTLPGRRCQETSDVNAQSIAIPASLGWIVGPSRMPNVVGLWDDQVREEKRR